jgi:hypothetical protein
VGYELGPNVLLPDGDLFIIGANGNTAIYTPSTNTWVAGPVIPNGMGADDAPAAVLPNGNVLFAADLPLFNGPTQLFDYDPVANTIARVTTPDDSNLAANPAYGLRMVMLPTGQVHFSDASNQLWLYTPDGAPQPNWLPTIQNIKNMGDGTYLLRGKQINGMDAGAAYGDDAEMDSNYPIVALSSGGNVYYARTFNWSITGVATGQQMETTKFTLPPGLPEGTYNLTVSGAGYVSNPVSFTVGEGGDSLPNATTTTTSPSLDASRLIQPSRSLGEGPRLIIVGLPTFNLAVLFGAGSAGTTATALQFPGSQGAATAAAQNLQLLDVSGPQIIVGVQPAVQDAVASAVASEKDAIDAVFANDLNELNGQLP